jgi:hypothetical protein
MKRLRNRKNVGYWIILFCFFCLFSSTSSAASDRWPTASWRTSTPEEQGMHSEKLNNIMEQTFREKYSIDSITIKLYFT